MKHKIAALVIVLFGPLANADVVSNYKLTQALFADGTVLRGIWSYNKTRDAVINARFESLGRNGEVLDQWQDHGTPIPNVKGRIVASDVHFQLRSSKVAAPILGIQFNQTSGLLVPPGSNGPGTFMGNPKGMGDSVLIQSRDVHVVEDCASTAKSLQSLAHCGAYQKATYRGQRPSDPQGRLLIPNPERGFRHEAIVSLGPLSAVPADPEPPSSPRLNQPFSPNMDLSGDALSRLYQKITYPPKQRLQGEQYQVVQQYIYLDKFTKTADLSAALPDLEHVFSQAKKARVKLLLIFAYKYKDSISEPNPDIVRSHMLALQPVFARHLGEIYAFQFGWFGKWGELHSTGYSMEKRKFMMDSFLETMPPERKVTIRSTKHRDLIVANSPKNNLIVGFGNAFYTLDDHKYAAGNDYTTGSRDYNEAVKWGPSTIVDIEMPYTSPVDPVTGQYRFGEDAWYMNHVPKNFAWGSIWRFAKLGVTTFSISHCQSPCINSLRLDLVTLDQFKKLNLVTDQDYFLDQNRAVDRTAFDYIRDHLGYRLRLTEAIFPAVQPRGQAASFSFKLDNSGFSRPVNHRPFDVVLLDGSDNVVWRQRAYATSDEWRPGVEASVALPNRVIDIPAGNYRVAVALPDASKEAEKISEYAIQLANGGDNFSWITTAEDRFNVIGTMNVTGTR